MAIQRATDPNSPLTPALIQKLVEHISDGMPPEWAAKACGVTPGTLRHWLDLGAKRDGMQPYRGFVFRMAQAEAQLMARKVKDWKDGIPGSTEFLKLRFPRVWGPKAEPFLELMPQATSHADELSALEEILKDPYAFGLEDLFEKHGRLRADGT